MSGPEIDFLREDDAGAAVSEPAAETVDVVQAAPETVAAPAVTTTPAKEDSHVPLAALMAERDKRQKEEASRKALEARLAEFEKQRPQVPAFYENPELHVQQRLQDAEHRAQQRLFNALEAEARESFPDYEEVVAELAEQAQGNPALVQQVFNSPNPAKAAYKLGKQMREMKAMQDPAAYRASLETEIRAQIAKEAEAKESARRVAEAAIPPELSAARATKDAEVAPDDSLDSILSTRRKR